MQRAKDVPEEAGFINDLIFKENSYGTHLKVILFCMGLSYIMIPKVYGILYTTAHYVERFEHIDRVFCCRYYFLSGKENRWDN